MAASHASMRSGCVAVQAIRSTGTFGDDGQMTVAQVETEQVGIGGGVGRILDIRPASEAP